MNKIKILAELKNAIYPSDEDDGIEHVDMSYIEFMAKLDKLAEDTKETHFDLVLEDIPHDKKTK